MRLCLVVSALILVAACSSAPTSATARGPSVNGMWSATDTAQRVLTLTLIQTGDSIAGTGSIGAMALSIAGRNTGVAGCGCNCPCPLIMPVNLSIADASHDTLQVRGAFGGDSNHFNMLIRQSTGPAPGFPFDTADTVTMLRATLVANH